MANNNQAQTAAQPQRQYNDGQSKFTGGAFMYAIIRGLTVFVSVITLGLAYPAMVCWKQRWIARRTYIDGRQLCFDGKAIQLFGKYILWLLLSVVTLGVYFILKGAILMRAWVTSHTHFVDSAPQKGEENKSKFDGKWYQLLGVNVLTGFVTIITATLGAYWAHCYKERWFCKHQYYDGIQLTFDGRAIQYFGKRLGWTLLTIITAGIYSFWLAVKSKKWTISHTHINKKQVVVNSAAARSQTSAPQASAPANVTAPQQPVPPTVATSVDDDDDDDDD